MGTWTHPCLRPHFMYQCWGQILSNQPCPLGAMLVVTKINVCALFSQVCVSVV